MPEIQTFLSEECDIIVSITTIRNWLKDNKVFRYFGDEDMKEFKRSQQTTKRAYEKRRRERALEHFKLMVRDEMISISDVMSCIKDMDIEINVGIVEKLWDRIAKRDL